MLRGWALQRSLSSGLSRGAIFTRFNGSAAASQEQEVPEYSIPQDLVLPKFLNGHWRPSKLSGRKIALIKKEHRENDQEWIEPRPWRNNGRRPYRTVDQHKGHKWDRTKEARLAKIEKNMLKMPELIRKYHKEERDRKIKTTSEEQWLYPHEIKRFQKKKQKKRKLAEGEEEKTTHSRADQEANDEHQF